MKGDDGTGFHNWNRVTVEAKVTVVVTRILALGHFHILVL